MNTAMHLTLFIIIFVKFRKLQKKIITYKTFPKYISWLLIGSWKGHWTWTSSFSDLFVLCAITRYVFNWLNHDVLSNNWVTRSISCFFCCLDNSFPSTGVPLRCFPPSFCFLLFFPMVIVQTVKENNMDYSHSPEFT